MTNYSVANADVSLQVVGGAYINLGGEIASIKPALEANFAEEPVYGREFPHYTMTHLSGGLDVSGLRLGDTAGDPFYDELHVENNTRAFFVVEHIAAGFMCPAGYIELKSGDIMDGDGVFKIDGGSMAVSQDNFEEWRIGSILPSTRNTWNNQGAQGGRWPAPVGGQLAVINVINPGSLTALELQLNKGGNTFRLAAQKDGGSVRAGITRGPLLNGTARVPSSSLTGYRWRISSTGTAGSLKFRISVIHLF